MAHNLILGMTESGKTTLAKELCLRLKARGISTLVLDSLSDPGWEADFITENPDEFLSVYFDPNTRYCAAFIDEAGDYAGRYDWAMVKSATRGRHWGHMNFYISQRGIQIARTIRDQCSNLFFQNIRRFNSFV